MKRNWLQHHLSSSEFAKLRLDTGETMALARQLLYLRKKAYDVKYAQRKGRFFVPVSNEIPNGADRHSYKTRDRQGTARISGNYGDDAPRAATLLKETIGQIKGIRMSYGFTIQDLRRAALYDEPLDATEAAAAREGIEDGFETCAAVGATDEGLTGLLNNGGVSLSSPVHGTWTLGTTTGEQMIEDLNVGIKDIITDTKDTQPPTDVILGTDEYSVFSQTLMGVSNQETALSVFLRTNPYIKMVDQWTRCDTAAANGTDPRAVIYRKDSDVLEHDIPQEFEQFAPEMRNLEFITQVHGRSAGVTVRYPKAIRYMDGL